MELVGLSYIGSHCPENCQPLPILSIDQVGSYALVPGKMAWPRSSSAPSVGDGERSNINLDDLPDLTGQFPVLNAYTQIIFGFELPLDCDRNAAVAIP
jgi:hypothetical protein